MDTKGAPLVRKDGCALAHLQDGPLAEMLVLVNGQVPPVFMDEPRERTMLDVPTRRLCWNEKTKIYEEAV